jgi:hypothetical protein
MPDPQVDTLGRVLAQPAGVTGHLRQTLLTWQARLEAQPAMVQRFLEAQGRQLAEALLRPSAASQVRFALPDRVKPEPAEAEQVVPPEMREQLAGGLMERLARTTAGAVLRERLAELEQSPNRAVAAAAGLLRHATALQLVYALLPAGRAVQYAAAPGDEIPSRPVADALSPESAITASTDAIAEDGADEPGRGALQVPYVPAARRFYMPQWVAFDERDELLVGAAAEAEAHVASMQRFVAGLHAAVALAPYVVADEVYQQKRYGMLGQLVNQGRALARFQTREIVQSIKQRAAAQDLNRGLSLSLPYFDDQDLRLRTYRFEVVPAGRIMFVPGFVVRAAREAQAKVAQDTRLSPSTRRHLLDELQTLERAFAPTSDLG